MADISEYSVFDGIEFKPEVKELMNLFTEAWEQCKATNCGECNYRHGREYYSIVTCTCERYAEKMLENGYKCVRTEAIKPMTNGDRIRAMSNSELSKWFCHNRGCERCEFNTLYGCTLLDWLEREQVNTD